MNCPKCANPLPQGAAFCPVCNEPVNVYAVQPNAYVYPPVYPQQGYEQPAAQPYRQPPMGAQQAAGAAQPQMNGQMMGAAAQPQGYTQQPVYQQNYAQYQQNGYPPGYQQPYIYGQQPVREGNSLMSVLSALPRAFLDSFTKPAEVLRGLAERRDLLTGPIVTCVVLLLSFLGGMVVLRSFISVIFSAISALTGMSLASTSASMNQGISYIAGRVAPAVGGIVVLCQLIAMLVMLGVFLVYVCAICKVRFSPEMALGFVAVTTLPTAAIALLAMLLSLLSPWLAVILILCGMAVSEVQLCSMLPALTGRNDTQLLPAKMLCVIASLLLILALNGLVGGALMGGVMQRILILLSNVGSLI